MSKNVKTASLQARVWRSKTRVLHACMQSFTVPRRGHTICLKGLEHTVVSLTLQKTQAGARFILIKVIKSVCDSWVGAWVGARNPTPPSKKN